MPRKKIIFSKALEIQMLAFDRTQQEKIIKFWKRIDPKLWDAPHGRVWESINDNVCFCAKNFYANSSHDSVRTEVIIVNKRSDPDAEWHELRLVKFECFYLDSFDNCETRRLRGKRTKIGSKN